MKASAAAEAFLSACLHSSARLGAFHRRHCPVTEVPIAEVILSAVAGAGKRICHGVEGPLRLRRSIGATIGIPPCWLPLRNSKAAKPFKTRQIEFLTIL